MGRKMYLQDTRGKPLNQFNHSLILPKHKYDPTVFLLENFHQHTFTYKIKSMLLSLAFRPHHTVCLLVIPASSSFLFPPELQAHNGSGSGLYILPRPSPLHTLLAQLNPHILQVPTYLKLEAITQIPNNS